MSIRQYSKNCWRVYGYLHGDELQIYVDSEDVAKRVDALMQAEKQQYQNSGPAWNRKKRSSAKAKDLPVGLTESHRTYKRGEHTYEEHTIRALIWGGDCVVKSISRAFGKIRTRDEAIVEVLELRQAYFEKHLKS